MLVLEFAKENPAFFSAVLLAVFWVLKSALGPLMSRIPCAVANMFAQGRLRVSVLFNLHDWRWYDIVENTRGRVQGGGFMLKDATVLATCKRCGYHLTQNAG